MDLLVIAFYSSVLTYYLGVLFYMLPIPIYGLKKWAPQLMIDGLFSAVLVFSYNVLLWIIDYFGGLLGADWEVYNSWVSSEVSALVSLMVALKAIGIGLSSIGLQFLASGLISPLISTLTYVLLFILTFTTLSYVLKILSPTLMALGILLHSLPFRLSRSSGAMILAVVIVFSIGTPLMPKFIDMLSTPQILRPITTHGFLQAVIYVKDSTGKPLSYALTEIYDTSRNNTLLARYLADGLGVVNASTIDTGIPSTSFTLNISIAGYQFYKVIDPKEYPYINNTSVVNITIRAPNIIQLKPLREVIVFNASYSIGSRSSDSLQLYINATSSTALIAVGLEEDTLLVSINYEYRSPDTVYHYTWGELGFKAYMYHLDPGLNTVSITVINDNTPIPSFTVIKYVRDTLGLNPDSPNTYIQPVIFYVYRLLVAPLVYVSILFSTSIALSKLLGGVSSRIARRMWRGVGRGLRNYGGLGEYSTLLSGF